MATRKSTNKSASTKKNTSSSKNSGRKGIFNSGKQTSEDRRSRRVPLTEEERAFENDMKRDILLILLFGLIILLTIANFGYAGNVGSFCAGIMFGLFGWISYILPIAVFLVILFCISNRGSRTVPRVIIALLLLLFSVEIIAELVSVVSFNDLTLSPAEIYRRCAVYKNGGGILGGIPAWFLYTNMGISGTIVIVLVAILAGVILLSGKSFSRQYKKHKQSRSESKQYIKPAKRTNPIASVLVAAASHFRNFFASVRNDLSEIRSSKNDDYDEDWDYREEEDNSDSYSEEEKIPFSVEYFDEDADIPDSEFEELTRRSEKRPAREKAAFHDIPRESPSGQKSSDGFSEADMHEIRFVENETENRTIHQDLRTKNNSENSTRKKTQRSSQTEPEFNEPEMYEYEDDIDITVNREREGRKRGSAGNGALRKSVSISAPEAPKYTFPSLNLLERGKRGRNGNSDNELKATARRLQDTLRTFGVNVTITEISQGPSVTRFELQPEKGVKVSRIVALSDDIKLNLAATEIRIEAPIPGKSAIGIEVPNKETTVVALRDILETPEFRNSKSKLAFAVGKDIGGQTIVTDIAKMPHLLIAGATGSGKSVCINTIIMSLLYKASPDEVKLLMIDPKVVELSIYNGIPHLLLPVVTDTRKAATALNWAVAEMTNRYNKFAQAGVRDLNGYNAMVKAYEKNGSKDDFIDPEMAEEMKVMPRIVVIVDELADLMMVAKNEVETAICRLAQLARAAGIHLIIATQRPSVDVITGLIKANMPSRIAFAVTSQVDSRTILDMAGGEKLIGMGDMLFYPVNYQKPARIQGAFVSDEEVSAVVDMICRKNANYTSEESEKIAQTIEQAAAGTPAKGGMDFDMGGGKVSKYDEHFEEAGRFIIDKNKASIGMLQRIFKIGFNRAARIMDQLCEAGVVGDENGTKSRQILMSKEEFENFIENEM